MRQQVFNERFDPRVRLAERDKAAAQGVNLDISTAQTVRLLLGVLF